MIQEYLKNLDSLIHYLKYASEQLLALNEELEQENDERSDK